MTLPKIRSISLLIVAALFASAGTLDATFHKLKKAELETGTTTLNQKVNALLTNLGAVQVYGIVAEGKVTSFDEAITALNNATGDAIDTALAQVEKEHAAFYQIWDGSKALRDETAQLISELQGTRDYLLNRDKSGNKKICEAFDKAKPKYQSLLNREEGLKRAYESATRRVSLDIPVVGTYLSSQTTSPTDTAKVPAAAWISAQTLSEPGRGALVFTMLCSEVAAGAADQSNVIVAFVPSASTTVNPFQNTFFVHLGSPVTTDGVTMANRSSYVSLGVPPAKETPAAEQAVFASPGADVIPNKGPDGRSLVPVDVRIDLDQPQGYFLVRVKAHGAPDSAYKIVISPNEATKALLSKITQPLQFFAFGSQLASATIYDLKAEPLAAVSPEGFDEISGQDAIAQNDSAVIGEDKAGKSTIFAIADTGTAILTIQAGDADDSWQAMPFGIPVEIDSNVTIAQLAANADQELYLLLKQKKASAGDHDGAVYRCNLAAAGEPNFETLGNAAIFRCITSDKKNSLFALDATGNVWHAAGPGAVAKMTASGLPATATLKSLVASSDVLLGLDANGSLWSGTVDTTAKTVAFAAFGQKVGDQAFTLQSVAAASKTNVMGVTSSGQVVVFKDASWSFLPVSKTDSSPVAGFSDVVMAADGQVALVAYDSLFHKGASAKKDDGKDKDKDKDKNPGTKGNDKPSANKPAPRGKGTAKPAPRTGRGGGTSRRSQTPAGKKQGRGNKVKKPAQLPNLGTDVKPADVKPADAKPADAKPADVKPDAKPAAKARTPIKKGRASGNPRSAGNKVAPRRAAPAKRPAASGNNAA